MHRSVVDGPPAAYGDGMECRAMSAPGDGGPERKSRRLQIAEARLAAEYIERAGAWAADVDQSIAAELRALHAQMLRQIEVLERFEGIDSDAR